MTAMQTFAADFKIDPLPVCTDTKISDAIKASLNDKGMRLISKEGKTIADLWLKKEVTPNASPSDGEPFAQIKEGAFIGVITFPEKTNDYRDQAVKAGTYTLRYGVSAQDGAHLGVSPTKHFFLLTLPTEDKDPKDLTPAETLKLSRTASGTGHPAPMALNVATTADKSMPQLVAGEHEHVTLDFKLKLKSGEIAVGFIVVGKTAE
ncbi:MAG: hypothetical protein HOP19_19885 [Acidobacteria bacterium]|nr:hypothetical protein [Acidobacteriota bacterium]